MTTASKHFAALIAALVLTACSAETGIVIQVSADESVSESIERLEFFVGVQQPGATGVAGDFVNDPDPSETTDFIGGRDLHADPYRLLLRKGGNVDTSLMVVVLGYKGEELEGAGMLTDPISFVDEKVLMWAVVLSSPGGNGPTVGPTGCLSWVVNDTRFIIASPDDRDCDGDPASTDCNDMDKTVRHGATEICDNGIDDNCDGTKDEETDADDDQVTNCDGDCNDNDDTVYPGATELCDGKDNDCNEVCDDGAADPDDDNYTSCGTKILEDGTCSDMSSSNIDCAPQDKDINPGAEEVCDGIDNNCDTHCDENQDPDSDTYTECGSVVDACVGVAEADKDCKPGDGEVYPSAEELCDGKDNNCDEVFYPAVVPCYAVDNNNGGLCTLGSRQCGDKNGTGWGGPCMPSSAGDPGNRVDAALCTAYDNCVSADEADPFECANAAVITMQIDCTVYHSATGELCPNAEARLPNIATALDNATCTAVIGPGAAVEHYDIRLRALDVTTDGGVLVNNCEAVVRVNGVATEPGHDSRVVYQKASDLGGTNLNTVRKLDFSPMTVTSCPASGLMCQGLVAPNMTNP
jgi:hypothetical protein